MGDAESYEDSAWTEPVQFHKNYESGCIYTLINNNTEYEITRVGSASGEVRVEEYYRDKPVTKIAASAFRGSPRVEKILVGNNVRYIGDSAFYKCTKLTEVTIPDSVTYLGAAAFQLCSALKVVNIPKAVDIVRESTFTTKSRRLKFPHFRIARHLRAL